jgi:hypothetical protein
MGAGVFSFVIENLGGSHCLFQVREVLDREGIPELSIAQFDQI